MPIYTCNIILSRNIILLRVLDVFFIIIIIKYISATVTAIGVIEKYAEVGSTIKYYRFHYNLIFIDKYYRFEVSE